MTTASIVLFNSSKSDIATVIGCADRSSISTIYVVDNSPLDNLRQFVLSLSPKVKYFYGQGNVGYGAAHNVAIGEAIEAGAKYHVVINPDIHFGDNTIEALTEYMDNNEDVGQVMPKVFYPDGSLQYLCKLLPNPFDLLVRRFIPIKALQKTLAKRYELHALDYDKIYEIPSLSGCFMFLRCSTLLESGLFDDRFFMYAEDLDLCRRIGEKSKTVFYPKVTITHDHAKGSYRNRKLLTYHIQSVIKYFNKWGWFFESKRREINRKTLASIKESR